MKQIKLVIWDLDETFWQGTLSEGPITYLQTNHDTVIKLTSRGILNSICSKNTFDDARACLEKHGVWNFFVFPKIDWQPKGQMITSLLEDIQLRPENVLFIDDNHLNLAEAKYFNPEIQTAGPDIISSLLNLDACRGKDDSALSRLTQYKLLEQKILDQKMAKRSNEEFLRSCDICVEVCHACEPERERILELINRTNQLNYTKHRLTEAEAEELFANPAIAKGYLKVKDRYGDYGVCGFYAQRNGRLEHFLFSCRIMNMGVEKWLYKRLGCPEIEISGEVVTPLSGGAEIDWIHEASVELAAQQAVRLSKEQKSVRVIVKGGCDLLQIKNYLIKGAHYDSEVNYVSAKGIMVNNSHTEVLRRCTTATLDVYGEVIDKIKFLDRDAFKTHFFSGQHNVYIYSALEDYTRGLYQYNHTDFLIAFDSFTLDATQRENWSAYLHLHEKHKLDISFLEWFSANFKFRGLIAPDAFRQNINWICDRIGREKLLIILNGSEVEYYPYPEKKRWECHKKMNALLEDAVRGRQNVIICDIREFVKSPEDHRHNIRHYSRKVYFQIAQKMNEIIEQHYDVSLGFWEKQWNLFRINKKLARKYIKTNIRRVFKNCCPQNKQN